MSRRAMVVAVLSAVAIAASGCGGGSDAEAESPVDITKLRAELKERFGTPPNEAPWYRHITAINWANGKIEIATDLSEEYVPEESDETGSICGTPLKLAFEEQAEQAEPYGVIVVVLDSDGVEMGGCG